VGARAECGGAIQSERCRTAAAREKAARVSRGRRRGRRREREPGEVGGLSWERCVCFGGYFFSARLDGLAIAGAVASRVEVD
jgi:hypothetical protein